LPRLLHVSDVHFGPKHLAEPANAVRALAESEAPDVVVVSGDLTQRAKPAQFRSARLYLESFAAPVVFVPGNHDVPLYRVWERALVPFGAWRRHFHAELVRDFVSPELAVLGVNTAHAWTTKHGRLRRADLLDLERRLGAVPEGAHRIVVAHHPVAVAPELGGEPVSRRGGALLELAGRHGVRVVLCGHLHHSFAVPGGGGNGPVVLHCGTTTSSRGRGSERGLNSLHWIEIDDEGTTVERRRFDPGSGRFVPAERLRFGRDGRSPQQTAAPPGTPG